MSLGSGKVDRAQRRVCRLGHGVGGLRTEVSEMRTKFEKRSWRVRGSGVAWPILRKLLNTRWDCISCLRFRAERRSNCSSETTGEPAGSAGAHGLHCGLAHRRSPLSPGPGLTFSSPEAGQPLTGFGPTASPDPRSQGTLRPRASGILTQDVGPTAQWKPRPQS